MAQTTLSYLVNVTNMPMPINLTKVNVSVVIFTFDTMIRLVQNLPVFVWLLFRRESGRRVSLYGHFRAY
jgi:hypothetical protein